MDIKVGSLVRLKKGIKLGDLRSGCTDSNLAYQLKDSYLVGMSVLNFLEVSAVEEESVTVRTTFVEYGIEGAARPIRRDLTVTRDFFNSNFTVIKLQE